jgi:hypothetical protein
MWNLFLQCEIFCYFFKISTMDYYCLADYSNVNTSDIISSLAYIWWSIWNMFVTSESKHVSNISLWIIVSFLTKLVLTTMNTTGFMHESGNAKPFGTLYFISSRGHSYFSFTVSSTCDKVCQWLATCRWFSPGTPVSSTNKTYNEILLKLR